MVATGDKIKILKEIRNYDSTCELLNNDLIEVTGKRRFTFSTLNGEIAAEKIIEHIFMKKDFKITEFQITRPDLETIFLRATKKNWEKNQ